MNKSLTFIFMFLIKVSLGNLQKEIEAHLNGTENQLSRKRRYLVFPEGSSLQLVFCLTMPSIGMGQIFTVGSTAALAWELPHNPFEPFRKPSELLHRIDYDKFDKSSSEGWMLYKDSPAAVNYGKTYYNPFLTEKPASDGSFNLSANKATTSNFRKMNIMFTNNKKHKATQENLPEEYINPVYHKIYRRTRRDLYSKIEKLFTALNRDGKACLLKSICEVTKKTQERGTFMEEIIKVIFRVRHRKDYEEYDHYDTAANQGHNCSEMYPSCKYSIWDSLFT